MYLNENADFARIIRLFDVEKCLQPPFDHHVRIAAFATGAAEGAGRETHLAAAPAAAVPRVAAGVCRVEAGLLRRERTGKVDTADGVAPAPRRRRGDGATAGAAPCPARSSCPGLAVLTGLTSRSTYHPPPFDPNRPPLHRSHAHLRAAARAAAGVGAADATCYQHQRRARHCHPPGVGSG